MTHSITARFRQMGAQADVVTHSGGRMTRRVELDIRRDARGAYFYISHRWDIRLDVLDVVADDRHLLLRATDERTGQPDADVSQFLCGHDERSWFVAAIPESDRVMSVQGAKDALKPQAVWDAMRNAAVPAHERDARVNDAFIRQGEWFFLPRPEMEVSELNALRHEPIQRGAGRPHVCQFLCREGGDEVYVSAGYPNGLTRKEYHQLPRAQRYRWYWTVTRRDARVYVRGAIQHPDHAGVFLWCWHEVVPNRETEASAMEEVAFLD
jgi:hypothetical protein